MKPASENIELLKLENHFCFPVYVASRLLIRQYHPYLSEIGLTYPQYLVMLVLWEKNEQTVNEIKEKLYLNTNTVTPLLKRMEKLSLLERERSKKDERKVLLKLTPKGIKLKEKAGEIPKAFTEKICDYEGMSDDMINMKNFLEKIIKLMSND